MPAFGPALGLSSTLCPGRALLCAGIVVTRFLTGVTTCLATCLTALLAGGGGGSGKRCMEGLLPLALILGCKDWVASIFGCPLGRRPLPWRTRPHQGVFKLASAYVALKH